MDTVEFLKKARDEVQALTDGGSSKLSAEVIGWIRRDMSQSSDYSRPMQLAAQNYPDLSRALDDARRAFNVMGFIDAKSIGGRLFIEKILSVSLRRLNGMLYTLGEQETPDPEAMDKAFKKIDIARQRLSMAQKSPQSDAWLDEIFEKMTGIKGASDMIHAKTGELEKKLAARSLQQRARSLSIQMMTTRKKVI